jgi:hypothetical protein
MTKQDFKNVVVFDRPSGKILFCVDGAQDVPPICVITRKAVKHEMQYFINGVRIDPETDEWFQHYLKQSIYKTIRKIPRFRKCGGAQYRKVECFNQWNLKMFPKHRGWVECYQILNNPYIYIPVDIFNKTTSTKIRNEVIAEMKNSELPLKLISRLSGLDRTQIFRIIKKQKSKGMSKTKKAPSNKVKS